MNEKKFNLNLKQSVLGKKVNYNNSYDPNLLYAINRKLKRDEIGILSPLPFIGYDLWRAYEFSWLNAKGKPQIGVLELEIPHDSENIIESKSLKLYLFSFSNSKFKNWEEIKEIIMNDISLKCGKRIKLSKIEVDDSSRYSFAKLKGECIDLQDISCDDYSKVNPDYLVKERRYVSEILHTNLLKSNCLITSQPDWASVQIRYSGEKISQEGLLKYIVSFREHNEFHEQCIERIFNDILKQCKPISLCVVGFYTRRGGIDINPIRATNLESLVHMPKDHIRLFRQ